jgi:hypothetical protein
MILMQIRTNILNEFSEDFNFSMISRFKINASQVSFKHVRIFKSFQICSKAAYKHNLAHPKSIKNFENNANISDAVKV